MWLSVDRDELKAARTQLNLSVTKMANKLNTPKRTYEGWEQGRKIPGIVSAAIGFIEELKKRT